MLTACRSASLASSPSDQPLSQTSLAIAARFCAFIRFVYHLMHNMVGSIALNITRMMTFPGTYAGADAAVNIWVPTAQPGQGGGVYSGCEFSLTNVGDSKGC